MKASIQRRLATPVVLVLALLAPTAAVAQQHFPANEDLELMLRYLVEDGETPGIVLGVLDPDGTTRAVGYGSAGPDNRTPDPRSTFHIGALTMTFTATLLADMVIRGEVGLDDPVARYLPAAVSVPSRGGYEMTLGDLATHRSGLPAGDPAPGDAFSIDDLYGRVTQAELERPGRRYHFSHLGYALLGHALGRAAGMPYDALLRQRVLEPLGIARTTYAAAEARAEADDGSGPAAPEARRGATGLRSSAHDLLRFLKANVTAAGQDSPTTGLGRAMRMAHEIRVERGSPEEEVGYGLSWRTHSVAGEPPIISHAGGAPGATSLIAFDPDRGIGTVVLASTSGFDDWIGRDLLLFEPPSTGERPAVAPEVLRRYEGSYRANLGQYTAAHDGGHYFIRMEDDGWLTYQPRDRVRTRLYARSDSSFYMLRAPLTLTFGTVDDDVRMLIHIDEREPLAKARSWTAWKVDDQMPAPAAIAGNVPPWQRWGTGIRALGIAAALLLGTAIVRTLWKGARRRARAT